MTTHSHDQGVGAADARRRPSDDASPPSSPSLPRWLLPGMAALVVAVGLVVAGVVSASTLLYVGLFGGMLFMHLGGHGGHGGHGDQAGDEGRSAKDLSGRSDGSQPGAPGSHHGLDNRASTKQNQSETTNNDQNHSHGCH
ncbi:MAG: hypothetical protein HYX57_12780 [Chloroflexi bacterium]|nr:hypothetical protein [Chloroflexota bacterium]